MTHPSWAGFARRVLEKAIDAHGGTRAWRRAERLHLTVTELSGWLPRTHGLRITPARPLQIAIDPHACRTVFADYPQPGEWAIFDRGSVEVRDEGGRIPAASVDHRQTFIGRAKLRRWSPVDTAYFFGYALWHYHTLPFSLREARVVQADPPRQGQTAVSILVEFPPAVPTHSRRQRFFFGPCGRVVRHDYVAEVLGGWATAAHHWRGYHDVAGLAFAAHRRVYWRAGRRQLPFLVLDARFAPVRVESASPPVT